MKLPKVRPPKPKPLAPAPSGPPLVRAVVIDGQAVTLGCPYCAQRAHFHSPEGGHRVAHCWKPRVDPQHGYIIWVACTVLELPRRKTRRGR